MAIKPPTCRLCSNPHWSWERHVFPSVAAEKRVMRRALKGDKPVVLGAKPVTSAVKGVTCSECGGPVPEPKRGPVAKTCGATCRKRASRKKEGVGGR